MTFLEYEVRRLVDFVTGVFFGMRNDGDTLIADSTNPMLFTWGSGAGSGLDADTLDGSDGSAFAKLASANTFTAAQTVTLVRTLTTGSIADDAAYSWAPSKTRGVLILSPNGSGGMDTATGMVNYNTVAPSATAIALGSAVNVTNVALTGTTGTDGKVTFSAYTDGKCYIENRLGYSINYAILNI